MNRFKELKVWQKAIDIVVDVYKLTSEFPQHERFGLSSQVQRAAVSIPSNIAEGAGRNNKGEFNQFLGIANGSSFELETQLTISAKLGYADNQEIEKICIKLSEIQNMIFGLQKTLKN
jgi:four helix bundle protein